MNESVNILWSLPFQSLIVAKTKDAPAYMQAREYHKTSNHPFLRRRSRSWTLVGHINTILDKYYMTLIFRESLMLYRLS